MNKQEAIKRINDLWSFILEDGPFEVDLTIKNQVLDIISQIHEPQKVVVPKFVADWIEYCKRCNLDLQMTLSRLDDDWEVGDWAYDENDDLIPERVNMVTRAWHDGYDVEKEPLYTVEIPNPNSMATATILEKIIDGNHKTISLVFTHDKDWKNKSENHLTEAEIKKDFEWAWQWAKPVEVE